MRESAVRTELGIPRDKVARWAGVSTSTVVLYEANPLSVGEDKRVACARVYRELAHALERLRPKVA